MIKCIIGLKELFNIREYEEHSDAVNAINM